MKKSSIHTRTTFGVQASDFELFYRTHYRAISHYVLRRVPFDSHDDVVSSVFVVAWRKYSLTSEPSLAWLYRIASNEVAHERRRLARQPRLRELRDDDISANPPDPKSNVIALALRRLHDRDVELLRLIVVEELSREEAATVLRCTVETLNVRLHRARIRFANALDRVSFLPIDDSVTLENWKEAQ
jgi:RNA polymerase sigma-70 factor, ECF subfamily